MANSKNNLIGLLNSVARSNKGSGLAGVPGVMAKQSVSSPVTLKPGSLEGTRVSSGTAKTGLQGISFGKPSNARTPAQSPGTDWGKLLEQTATGGLSNALGGGFGLGSISGLSSIISSIAGLFGSGKATPAALQEFHLPGAQSQTITVGASGSSGSETTTQNLQDQSMQIAQAVKTALLHSSTLNDVIAEI